MRGGPGGRRRSCRPARCPRCPCRAGEAGELASGVPGVAALAVVLELAVLVVGEGAAVEGGDAVGVVEDGAGLGRGKCDASEGSGQAGLEAACVPGVVQVADRRARTVGVADRLDDAGRVVAGGASDAARQGRCLLPAHVVQAEGDLLGAGCEGLEDAGVVVVVAGRRSGSGHGLALVERVVVVRDGSGRAGADVQPVVNVVVEGLLAVLAVGDGLRQVDVAVVVDDRGLRGAVVFDAVSGGLRAAEQVVVGCRDLPGAAGDLLQSARCVVLEDGLGAERVGDRLGSVGVVVVPDRGVSAGVGEGPQVAVRVVVVGGGVAERVSDLARLVERVVGDCRDGARFVRHGARSAGRIRELATDAAFGVLDGDQVAVAVGVLGRRVGGVGDGLDLTVRLVGVLRHPVFGIGDGLQVVVGVVAEDRLVVHRVRCRRGLVERTVEGDRAGGTGVGRARQLDGLGDVAGCVVVELGAASVVVGHGIDAVVGTALVTGLAGEIGAVDSRLGGAEAVRVEGHPADRAARFGHLGGRDLVVGVGGVAEITGRTSAYVLILFQRAFAYIPSAARSRSSPSYRPTVYVQVARCPTKTPISMRSSRSGIGREKCTRSRSHRRLPCHSQR